MPLVGISDPSLAELPPTTQHALVSPRPTISILRNAGALARADQLNSTRSVDWCITFDEVRAPRSAHFVSNRYHLCVSPSRSDSHASFEKLTSVLRRTHSRPPPWLTSAFRGFTSIFFRDSPAKVPAMLLRSDPGPLKRYSTCGVPFPFSSMNFVSSAIQPLYELRPSLYTVIL